MKIADAVEAYTGAAWATKVLVDFNPLSKQRKIRTVYAPNTEMRKVHELLINSIKVKIRKGEIKLTPSGWIPGSDGLRNLRKHLKEGVFPRYWFVTDMKNAFLSADVSSLVIVMMQIFPGTDLDVLGEFVKRFLVNAEGKLAQGLPASPYLFSIWLEIALEKWLKLYAQKNNFTYTRLGDDIVFSSKVRLTRSHGGQILEFITNAGLRVNHRKTHYYDLAKIGAIHIHGIGLRNRKFSSVKFPQKKGELKLAHAKFQGELFVPRSYKIKLEGLLHAAIYGKRLISREKMAGHMGVFFSIQRGNLYSEQDRALVRLYRYWLKMLAV